MSERKVLIIVSVCTMMLFDHSRPDLWEWVVTAITLHLRTAKTTKGSTAV